MKLPFLCEVKTLSLYQIVDYVETRRGQSLAYLGGADVSKQRS